MDSDSLKEWNELQQTISNEIKIPRNEKFDHYISSFETENNNNYYNNKTDRVLGSFDKEFIHDGFALPVETLEQHFGISLGAAAEDDNNDKDNDGGVKSGLGAGLLRQYPGFVEQLRHDCHSQQEAYHLPHSSECSPPPLRTIGGVDISFVPDTDLGVACLVLLDFPSLEVQEVYYHHCTLQAPYRSGYLAFREVEPVMELFQQHRPSMKAAGRDPQLLVIDGGGVLHPRRAGLAAHLGYALNIPTIGCAKKMLVVETLSRETVEAAFRIPAVPVVEGEEAHPPFRPLVVPFPVDNTTTTTTTTQYRMYGYALQNGISAKKSIFISPGNKVGFAMALALILCCTRHRVPEPTRQADLLSRDYIRKHFPKVTSS